MTDPIIRKARRRVKAKKGFYVHLSSYLAVGIFFFLMNVLTFGESGEWWFFFPMLPWLVGLLIHYFVVFGLPGTNILTEGWEEREMEKELWRLRRREPSETDPALPDPDAGEAPEELELPDPKKIREKRWDREDLV